jgi:type IV fimbrial biogenesis protein FimT
MSIAIILLTLAIPSFRYVTNSNRIAGEINGLLGDLQFARAEAIKEGRSVTVCVSTNSTTCSANNTAWQNGWIVFSVPVPATNPIIILRVQPAFSGTDTLGANNNLSSITFNRDGYAGGTTAGTLITLHDATGTSAWTRCLALSLTGQMTTEMVTAPSNGCT